MVRAVSLRRTMSKRSNHVRRATRLKGWNGPSYPEECTEKPLRRTSYSCAHSGASGTAICQDWGKLRRGTQSSGSGHRWPANEGEEQCRKQVSEERLTECLIFERRWRIFSIRRRRFWMSGV